MTPGAPAKGCEGADATYAGPVRMQPGAGREPTLRFQSQLLAGCDARGQLKTAADEDGGDDQPKQVERADLTKSLDCLRTTNEMNVAAVVGAANPFEEPCRMIIDDHVVGRALGAV